MPSEKREESAEQQRRHQHDQHALVAHAGGADLQDAAGEGGRLAVVAAGDLGTQIRVAVSANNSYGTTTVQTAPVTIESPLSTTPIMPASS